MQCSYCRSENVDHANFCIACGHALSHPAVAGKAAVCASRRQHREFLHQRGHIRENRAKNENVIAPAVAASHVREATAKPVRRVHAPAPFEREEPVWQASYTADTSGFSYPEGNRDRDFNSFGTQTEYPRTAGRAGRFVFAGTLIVIAMLAGMAGAIWLQPEIVPQGIALIERAARILGLEVPGDDTKMTRKFGTSPEELPYDGRLGMDDSQEKNTKIPAANLPPVMNLPQAASRLPEESSGSSEAEHGDAALGENVPVKKAAVEDSGSQLSGEPAEPVAPEVAEDVKTADADATKTELVPPAKPRPKKDSVFHAIRNKEISRLRKQAAEELYAE